MKRLLLIAVLLTGLILPSFAQQDGDDDRPADDIKLQRGMKMFIRQRLQLTDDEAKKFEPLLEKYLTELRDAHVKNTDPLVRQQKKAEVRPRYRDEFKPIIGEKRANRVFVEEQSFRQQIRNYLRERRERGGGRSGSLRPLKR